MCCLTAVLLFVFTLVTCAYKKKSKIISLLLNRMIIAPIHRIYIRLKPSHLSDHKKKQQTLPVKMNFTYFRSYISDVMTRLF